MNDLILKRPIAVFYHCRMSGGPRPIDPGWSLKILCSQMEFLDDSGLLKEANEFHVGINGGPMDVDLAKPLLPERAKIIEHPQHYMGEVSTLHVLQKWSKTHNGWNVLYYHIKGATKANDKFWQSWRRCMENVVVGHWRTCVEELNNGMDTVGAHWIKKTDRIRYWGGNFWWATSEHLNELSPLPETATSRDNFCDGERWIGTCSYAPRYMDHAPHWPGPDCSKLMMK